MVIVQNGGMLFNTDWTQELPNRASSACAQQFAARGTSCAQRSRRWRCAVAVYQQPSGSHARAHACRPSRQPPCSSSSTTFIQPTHLPGQASEQAHERGLVHTQDAPHCLSLRLPVIFQCDKCECCAAGRPLTRDCLPLCRHCCVQGHLCGCGCGCCCCSIYGTMDAAAPLCDPLRTPLHLFLIAAGPWQACQLHCGWFCGDGGAVPLLQLDPSRLQGQRPRSSCTTATALNATATATTFMILMDLDRSITQLILLTISPCCTSAQPHEPGPLPPLLPHDDERPCVVQQADGCAHDTDGPHLPPQSGRGREQRQAAWVQGNVGNNR